MLEGNFRDVSLPGLLQFLATEINKSYRVKVTSNNHAGEIFVCKGAVTASSYGLLEGEDALCEFLSWKDGAFGVELLNPQIEIKKNLQFQIQPTATFADQSSFLNEQNVGLNSVLIASKLFGTPEWQDTVQQQPLERDDFMVLGWFASGRTMRQASREFNFDLVKATGILFRLVATKSILVMRPGSKDGKEPGIEPEEAGVSPATVQRFLTTGGQEAAAANVAHEAARALTQEAADAVAQDAFVSTSFKTDLTPRTIPQPVINPKVDMAQVRASMEARLRAKSVRSTRSGPAFSPEQVHDLTAQTSNEAQTAGAPGQRDANSVANQPGQLQLPNPSAVTLPPVPLRDLLTSQAANQRALEEAIVALNDYSDYNNRTQPQSAAPNQVLDSTSQAAPVIDSFSKPSPTPAPTPTASSSAPSPSPATGQTDFSAPARPPQPYSASPTPPSMFSPSQSGIDTNRPALPNNSDPQADLMSRSGVPPLATNNAFAKLVTDEAEMAAIEEASRLKTASLPLVSMDIERLLLATFKQTQFGKLALTNPSLDHLRRQTLLDVEAGKALTAVISEGNRPPAAVLSSYRYCLDRGYIESADPVISLTADLLLGRVELDQYLLQRRRITGDELRELTALAKKQGENLSALFLQNGYVTEEDLDTLTREQKRFAFK
ncbi:MAG: DUF4388 domain-containing protein [Candidatus Melainabacteria bacterium]|nr:MAG: DUF4388 domain-containing protein [Candidatus Melainabacteria bacterium]